MRKLILAAFAALSFATASAENIFEGLAYNIRVGYSIGGTAPLGMPASIRKLNDYTLTNNLQLGIDARHMFDSRWGVMAGLHFENKGMDEDARVKNYKMKIVRGGQELEGRFTGDVHTKVSEWMFTVPVLATYSVGKFLLKAGPYFSYVHSRSFSGDAHNGYLREGNPTGAKIQIGNDADTRGHYDFSHNMRRMQWGIDVGADWYFHKKTGIYADISWGLSGIHHSNFKTIEQTLYPIFGTLGVVYKLK